MTHVTQSDQWADLSPPAGGETRQQTATPTATPAPVSLRTLQLSPSAPEPNTAGPWSAALQSVMVQPDGQESSTCWSSRNTAGDCQVGLFAFYEVCREQHVPPLSQLTSFPPGGTAEQEHGSTRRVTSCHLSRCSASCLRDVDGNEIRASLWTRWNILQVEE